MNVAILIKATEMTKQTLIINVKQIPQSTVDELILCLSRSRAGALIMQDWKDIGDFNEELTKEIITIDKLLKELREL